VNERNSFIDPAAPMDANCPSLIAAQQSRAHRAVLLMAVVGMLLRRRLKYIARFAYYVAVHRGFKHVRWALAHEGTQW
jgi:hypothetical protein